MTEKFYITTTLPYVNAEPHIGFALEIVQADAIARHQRLRGKDVFFNFGVDEHGLKIYRKALEAGKSPQEYCDEYALKFDALKQGLNLSYTNFIRTTDTHHLAAAQEFWRRCLKNGDIYKKNYRIRYCVGCELEKSDSELEKCRCPLHPNQDLETYEEENYFFRFSKYQKPLLDFYERNPNFVVPAEKYNEIKSFAGRGLEDFSVSRLKNKMPWGIDIPDDPEHVMYVWFDALINYISALGWPEDLKRFESWWPGLQMAGKDNLRQQTAMWPAMLMSAGLPNSKQVFIHGFITVNGQKISKSLGNVINPLVLAEKYGTDAVRYYLLSKIHPWEDSDFTLERFEEIYNADLANGLGNLISRTLALRDKLSVKEPTGIDNNELKNLVVKTQRRSQETIEEFRFNEALATIWQLIAFCNQYIDKTKPWENKEGSKQVISDLLLVMSEIAGLLAPFLPGTSEKIQKQIASGQREILFPRL